MPERRCLLIVQRPAAEGQQRARGVIEAKRGGRQSEYLVLASEARTEQYVSVAFTGSVAHIVLGPPSPSAAAAPTAVVDLHIELRGEPLCFAAAQLRTTLSGQTTRCGPGRSTRWANVVAVFPRPMSSAAGSRRDRASPGTASTDSPRRW